MKTGTPVLLLAALLSALPAVAQDAAAPAAGWTDCDLHLNVVDPDPEGLNVRSSPGKPPGKVVAKLLPSGEWIDVHVVAQSGDWMRIDHAEAVDDAAVDGTKEVFRGSGWVHVVGLGISELLVGEGTLLRAGPDEESEIVRRILKPEDEPKRARVMGCRGPYLQVEADGASGWTRTFCTNERTTCS